MKLSLSKIGLWLSLFVSSIAIAQTVSQVYDNPAKPIVVTSNVREFTIVQPANPTTGYSWRIESYDQQLLKLVNSQYQAPTSQLVGAGGKMVWNFQATDAAFVKPTTTAIHLVYERSFAPQDNPTQVVFTVRSGS